MENDISHIFAEGDPEEAQRQHDALPKEAKDHLIKGFMHLAGHGKHPGKYQGPPIKKLDKEQGSDAWRSSPNAAGGAQGETGEETGLP